MGWGVRERGGGQSDGAAVNNGEVVNTSKITRVIFNKAEIFVKIN
jgi:hypothetical protein